MRHFDGERLFFKFRGRDVMLPESGASVRFARVAGLGLVADARDADELLTVQAGRLYLDEFIADEKRVRELLDNLRLDEARGGRRPKVDRGERRRVDARPGFERRHSAELEPFRLVEQRTGETLEPELIADCLGDFDEIILGRLDRTGLDRRPAELVASDADGFENRSTHFLDAFDRRGAIVEAVLFRLPGMAFHDADKFSGVNHFPTFE